MKYLLIFSLLLSSCTSLSISKPWPVQEDPYLLQPCSPLIIIEKNKQTSMATVVDVIEANYNSWHECSMKTNAWIKWYNTHWEGEK